MRKRNLYEEYFDWLCDFVEEGGVSYRKLLSTLHDIEFRWSILKDENRAGNGINLRYRFTLHKGYDSTISELLGGPCTVLEMIVALGLRAEETIMDDPKIGNRTSQWIKGMINSLGLGSMYDSNFDEEYVIERINIFLDREYEPNGKGGLFTIKDTDRDLRDVEIWTQLLWYLNKFI